MSNIADRTRSKKPKTSPSDNPTNENHIIQCVPSDTANMGSATDAKDFKFPQMNNVPVWKHFQKRRYKEWMMLLEGCLCGMVTNCRGTDAEKEDQANRIGMAALFYSAQSVEPDFELISILK